MADTKLRLGLKDPDGLWESLKDAGLDPNDLPPQVEKAVQKFFHFQEDFRIELDLETLDARVLRVSEPFRRG